MIESWILSKLTPLLGRPVIILRDPQRMIISSVEAVDGWGKNMWILPARLVEQWIARTDASPWERRIQQ